MASPLTLHDDRLFPADPGTREVARRIYATTRELPIISPHGHVPPRWLAHDEHFGNPTKLLLTPDHYINRVLHANGVELSDLGVGRGDQMSEADNRKAFRLLCEHWSDFNGTAMRYWLVDQLVGIFDADGNPISKVTLDSATKSAKFYVMANGPVTNATLQVKGAASSTAIWTKLVFDEPPIPHVQLATLYDRNGDGRGDSLHIKFNKELGGKNTLDSLKFAFGEGFPVQTKENWKVSSNNTELSIVSSNNCEPYKLCGFSSLIFTGGKEDIYTGSIDTWFTYT